MTQTQLNSSLYYECSKKELDLKKIEDLLRNGANPLGNTGEKTDTVYGELIEDCEENLVEITKIFLENGMKIKHSQIQEIDPLWSLAFKCDLDGIQSLQLLLESGLDYESAEELVDHIYIDYLVIEDALEGIEMDYIGFSYAMKMAMLCAAYPEVLEKSKSIQDFFEVSENEYDISKFKEYDNYDIKVEKKDEKNLLLHFCEKRSNQIVWTIHI